MLLFPTNLPFSSSVGNKQNKYFVFLGDVVVKFPEDDTYCLLPPNNSRKLVRKGKKVGILVKAQGKEYSATTYYDDINKCLCERTKKN